MKTLIPVPKFKETTTRPMTGHEHAELCQEAFDRAVWRGYHPTDLPEAGEVIEDDDEREERDQYAYRKRD